MTRRYIIDVIDRFWRTYVQAFGSLLLASGFGMDGVIDLSTVKRAAIAAVAALISLGMSLVARTVGDKESASLAKPPIVTP